MSIKRNNRPRGPTRLAARFTVRRLVWGGAVLCTAALLAALESTLLSRVPVPFLPPGTPSLGLAFALAVGYLSDRESGGIAGLVAGFMCDVAAAGADEVMLRPLIYFLCGYMCGFLSERWLGHNLPSYLVFVTLGSLCELSGMALLAAARAHTLPPAAYVLSLLVPDILLTVVFSVPLYFAVRAALKKR